jgi:hypothetical protein
MDQGTFCNWGTLCFYAPLNNCFWVVNLWISLHHTSKDRIYPEHEKHIEELNERMRGETLLSGPLMDGRGVTKFLAICEKKCLTSLRNKILKASNVLECDNSTGSL